MVAGALSEVRGPNGECGGGSGRGGGLEGTDAPTLKRYYQLQDFHSR